MHIRHSARARSNLRRCLFAFSAVLPPTLLPPMSEAGPLVLEEVAKLTSPDPSYFFGGRVAIDGDSIIVTGARLSGDPQFPNLDRVAFLFERTSSGAWVFVRKLIETSDEAESSVPEAVAMNGGVAAFARGPVHVFERTAAGWVSVPSTGFSQGRDVEVHSGMILASEGECSFSAELYEKQASGTWTITRTFSGPPRDEGACDDEFLGRDVDITSNRVILDAPDQQQTPAQCISGIGTQTDPGRSPPRRSYGPVGVRITLRRSGGDRR